MKGTQRPSSHCTRRAEVVGQANEVAIIAAHGNGGWTAPFFETVCRLELCRRSSQHGGWSWLMQERAVFAFFNSVFARSYS